MITDRSCDTLGLIGRVMMGKVYAKLHGRYFGSTPVYLDDRKSAAGEILTLALSYDFLEENDPGLRFGVTPQDGHEIANHLAECSSPGCREAKLRLGLAGKAFRDGFPEVIAIRCAVELGASAKSEWAYGIHSPFRIPDNNGWRESADFFEPYFRWFDGEQRKDFIWSSEVGWLRLSGKDIQATVNPEEGVFSFKVSGEEGKPERTAKVPLDLIRKLKISARYGHGSDGGTEYRWLNPQIYHVETLTDPQNQNTINTHGDVNIWLRGDVQGIYERARQFIQKGIPFSIG